MSKKKGMLSWLGFGKQTNNKKTEDSKEQAQEESNTSNKEAKIEVYDKNLIEVDRKSVV